MLPKAFAAFVQKSPLWVRAQATLKHLFQAQRLDDLFERTADKQYQRTLLVSALVDLLRDVVLGAEPSVYAA